MNSIPERLSALRREMAARKIDIYVVPTADFHESEYVGAHFMARKYITGFTGSAGTAGSPADSPSSPSTGLSASRPRTWPPA